MSAAHVSIAPASLDQIEFHKIRDLLLPYSYGEPGAALLRSLHPSYDLTFVQDRLDQVASYADILPHPARPRLDKYDDIAPALSRLRVEGFVLSQEEIHEIARQLTMILSVHDFLGKRDIAEAYPALSEWRKMVLDPSNVLQQIRAILDEKGEVRPDASPELLRIARARDEEVTRLNREFVRLISQYKSEGWLADTVESIRSGRRVLCVQAEHKRKIKGIIHDESTTGRTAFIEPEIIVGINNRIIEYDAEFKKEVYRLLRALCDDLRPRTDELDMVAAFIPHWDMIQCMAQLGRAYNGQKPLLQKEMLMRFVQARHPLLYIKNKARGKTVIAFDLVLHGPNRMLVLSGPNAGGKSILLKAVGLIQVMGQCGMLIPADGGSIIGMSAHIATDIGDQQSIEEDLSTYSSRLKNMKDTLQDATPSSLILIDEFGSGTDPKIGGAIAESILNALVKRGTFGVITTHYPNIKMYAHRTKGVVNGAMMFDKDKILPTYQLKIGKPGSSFAFEIAMRTGLPEDVLEYAQRKAGTQTLEMEDLIHHLDSQHSQMAGEVKDLQEKQKELDRLIANYEALRLDLEVKRKKFKMDQKKAQLHEVSQYEQELNVLLRDLKKEKDEEKARAQAEVIRKKRKKVDEEIKVLSEDLNVISTPTRPVKAGDHVKLKTTDQYGVVERMEKNKVVVNVGQWQMTVPLHEVVPSGTPVERNPHVSIQRDVVDYSKFENELDIRGMLPEEATRFLERFIDAAFMSHAHQIRIVHGKGTGTMRQLARKTMKGYPFKEVRSGIREEGGDGVTIGLL